MLASVEDVIECYRVVLGRPPENDRIVQQHLKGQPTVWDLVGVFINSDEFLGRNNARSHLSINKCFDDAYLANGLRREDRVRCFLHHHDVLSRTLQPEALKAVYFTSKTIYSVTLGTRYAVELYAPQTYLGEGELRIAFNADGQTLFTTSFSFVPGDAFGLAEEQILLVSRMQGVHGTHEALRAASKAMMEVHPQATLFSVLVGIATAAGVPSIACVSATNQICFTEREKALFEHTYDAFMTSLEAEEADAGLHIVPIPLVQKPLSMIASMRRLRTRKKRAFKAGIAAEAQAAWTSWSTRATV